MRQLVLEPDGWACKLSEAQPGPFLHSEDHLGFKSEYRTDDGRVMAYNEAGEFFAVGDDAIVQPLKPVWMESGFV